MPLVAATLLIRGGSAQEEATDAGLCHLTTEVLLQGTRKRRPHALAAEVESMGAFLGGHASDDLTEFGFVTPAQNLPRTLDVLIDCLTGSIFPQGELDRERAHILASLASRHDTIFNVAYDRLLSELYGSHPYGRLTEGTPKSLRRFGRTDLKRWRDQHFGPGRAIFSLVGPAPWAEMRKKMTAQWKKWPSGKVASAASCEMPVAHASPRTVDVHSTFEQAYAMTGLQGPSAGSPDLLPLKVLNNILGGGMSSRLFLSLREERGLAYEVSSFLSTRQHPAPWVFYVGCSPERRLEAEEMLEKELTRVLQHGVTAAEVTQAKEMMKASFLSDHQTRRRLAWYAAWWEFLGHDTSYDERFPQTIEAVSLEDVQNAAKKWLVLPRVTTRVYPATQP